MPVPRADDSDLVKKLVVRINPQGQRALKILAAEKNTTIVALAVEAFNDLLKKHKKRAVVTNPLED
jgi:F0F1-type ATP synthase delta subunit